MSFFLRELLSFTFCLSSFRLAASALETNFTLHYAVFKVLLVGSSGLEPPTSRLSGVRSNQLSYEPIPFRPRPFLRWKPQLVSCASLAQLKSWWR